MKNRFVLLIDVLLIPVAVFGAFVGRFDVGFLDYRPEFGRYLLAALIIKPAVFVSAGMYRRYWRYTSINDLGVVVASVSAASVAMAVYVVLDRARFPVGFSRGVLLNDWLMTFVAAAAVRVAIRVQHEFGNQPKSVPDARRVLIVGAGAAGTMVVREMRRNPQLGMEPVAFLDDDVAKIGKLIAGLRVLGRSETLPGRVKDVGASQVVIAMPTADGVAIRRILDQARHAGIQAQTVPGVYELLDGQASLRRLRTIEIEDLLRRKPAAGANTAGQVIQGRVVLITGAGGSIGYELARQVALESPSLLVLLGHGENSLFVAEAGLRRSSPNTPLKVVVADSRDAGRLREIFERFKPAVIFHAAAHKHVPLMEENPQEAVTNNISGTRNVVDEAIRAGVERLVLISTDKAVKPTSVMGATKRIAEAIVRRAARQSGRPYVVVRFGNVLGSRGSVVNTFKNQIQHGGPVTVTDPEMTRYFMTIPEAVHLVLQASGRGQGGELFVLNMGDPVRIVDLARDLITLSGLDPAAVPIVFTGVRPGEKLHEELFDAGMQVRPTTNPDVLEVIGTDECAGDELDELIGRLEAVARDGNRAAISQLLTQAIPGAALSAPTP